MDNQSKEWSRIQKLDGREGWVRTELIDFNDYVISFKPAYNVAVDKIMCANDNLRLRKQEGTIGWCYGGFLE